MAWSSPITWSSGMTLSGTTNTSSLNVQLAGNVRACRNLWDTAIHLSTTGSQSINSGVQTVVNWDISDWQANSSVTLWSSASASKLNCPVVGRYELLGSLEWNSNASGYRGVAWRPNGGSVFQIAFQELTVTGRTVNLPIAAVFDATVTGYVEVLAFQNSGAALTLHGGNPDRTRVAWRLIGATS